MRLSFHHQRIFDMQLFLFPRYRQKTRKQAFNETFVLPPRYRHPNIWRQRKEEELGIQEVGCNDTHFLSISCCFCSLFETIFWHSNPYESHTCASYPDTHKYDTWGAGLSVKPPFKKRKMANVVTPQTRKKDICCLTKIQGVFSTGTQLKS